jgi:hypothetical protein
MFRISAALVASVVLAAGVTPVLPAAPARAESKAAINLCRDILLPARPASNLGECLSYINASNNQSDGVVSHFCDFLIENDPDTFELLFVSRSECIRAYGLRGRWK